MASASGAAGFGPAKRSVTNLSRYADKPHSVADHVCALGRDKLEQRRVEFWIAAQGGELQHRGLAAAVGQFHALQYGETEAHADGLEIRFFLSRHGLDPFQAVLLSPVAELAGALDFVAAGEQRRRRRTK